MSELSYAELIAENARLRALLPPDLGPGLTFRVGRRCPENVYVSDGPGVDGFELGKMPTAEYAAHIARVLNAWDWPGEITEGRKVLDVQMQPNDADVATIRGYLVALADGVWRHREGFSGKRPFGNSGWEGELYTALLKAGLVSGKLDEDDYLEELDDEAADRLITAAIAELAVAR